MVRVVGAAAICWLLSVCTANAQSGATDSGVGFPTVAAALAALKAKPGVKISSNEGWLVIEEPADFTIWSFTPSNHYANPAVGRRSIVQEGSNIFVQTKLLCEAQKAACDRLRDDYVLLDKRMTESIKQQMQKKK